MVFCISHWGFNTSASGKCTYVNSTFSLNALSVSFKRYFEKTFLIFHKTQEMKAEVCETLPDTAFAVKSSSLIRPNTCPLPNYVQPRGISHYHGKVPLKHWQLSTILCHHILEYCNCYIHQHDILVSNLYTL